MRKLYKAFLIIFILIPMQISFNNFGLHSILHNDIDDPETTEQISTVFYEHTDTDLDSTKKSFAHQINDKLSITESTEPPLTTIDSNIVKQELKDESQESSNENIQDSTVDTGTETIVDLKPGDQKAIKEVSEASKEAQGPVETTEPESINDTNLITSKNEKKVEELKSNEAVEVTKEPEPTPQPETPTITEAPVKKVKPDIESFEEWKDIKLKEEAKIKGEKKKNEIESKKAVNQETVSNSSDKSETDGKPTSLDTSSEDSEESENVEPAEGRKKNYASPDCGAKLISHNPESNHPSHILLESKDDYMLNSCSNRVWFTVELCEPIKLAKFELANLELFSNVPKQFRVYASERFVQSTNSKDWPNKYLIGTYEASNLRTIQQFLIGDTVNQTSQDSNRSEKAINPATLVYAKYVRFEMISHYGNQHYCPLSLLRIYGTTISEEHEAELQQIENQKNDFPEEIDATVTPEEMKTESTTELPFTIKPFQKTASALNEMSVLFFNNLISLVSQKLENFKRVKKPTTEPIIELVNTTTEAQLSDSEEQFILFDFYKILCSCHSFVDNEFLECCQCLSRLNGSNDALDNSWKSFNWLNDKCGYFFMMNSKDNAILDGYLKNMKFSLENEKRITGEESLQDDQSYLKITMNKINYFIKNNLVKDHLPLKVISDEKPEKDLKVPSEISDRIKETINSEEPPVQPERSATIAIPVEQAEDETNKNTDLKAENPQQVNSSLVKSENEAKPAEVTMLSTDESALFNEIPTTESAQDLAQIVDQKTATANTVTPPASTQTPTTTSPAPPTIPLVTKDPILVYSKDPIFMRLSNRIKILELNMSLSSQYLEKLSQHYRVQMDEMERTFNFTTTALKEATRVSDERDHKQHERIIMLEKRLETLQKLCDSYEAIFENLKFHSDIQTIAVICIITSLLVVEFLRQCFFKKKPAKLFKSLSSKQIEMLIEKRVKCLISEHSLDADSSKKLNDLVSMKYMVESEECTTSETGYGEDSVETLVPSLPISNSRSQIADPNKIEVI